MLRVFVRCTFQWSGGNKSWDVGLFSWLALHFARGTNKKAWSPEKVLLLLLLLSKQKEVAVNARADVLCVLFVLVSFLGDW